MRPTKDIMSRSADVDVIKSPEEILEMIKKNNMDTIKLLDMQIYLYKALEAAYAKEKALQSVPDRVQEG